MCVCVFVYITYTEKNRKHHMMRISNSKPVEKKTTGSEEMYFHDVLVKGDLCYASSPIKQLYAVKTVEGDPSYAPPPPSYTAL